MISEKIRQKIKIKLVKLNMTQKDLATQFNVSLQNLNNTLQGRQENLILEEKLMEFLNGK